MKRIIMVIATTMLCRALLSDTNELSHVRAELEELEAHCASRNWNYRVINEVYNFEWLHTTPSYSHFADAVSNCWGDVLADFGNVATNDFERLLLLGVGKHYGEDYYMDYLSGLADLRTNNVITAKEFTWARISTRHDLRSCFFRRYQESHVRGIVEKMILAEPQRTNFWNCVLTGDAYTNYLEEVEAGLWQ